MHQYWMTTCIVQPHVLFHCGTRAPHFSPIIYIWHPCLHKQMGLILIPSHTHTACCFNVPFILWPNMILLYIHSAASHDITLYERAWLSYVSSRCTQSSYATSATAETFWFILSSLMYISSRRCYIRTLQYTHSSAVAVNFWMCGCTRTRWKSV